MSVSAVLISLLFCLPVAAVLGETSDATDNAFAPDPPRAQAGDFNINKSGPLQCPFKWDGNVIVKTGVSAIFSGCAFHIIQHPGDDHNLIIENNAVLSIVGASQVSTSDGHALDIIGIGSAGLKVSDSRILLEGGSISGSFGSRIEIEDSVVAAASLDAIAPVDIKRSTISVMQVRLERDSLFDTVTLNGALDVVGVNANLTDTPVQYLNVSAPGLVRLYRWLEVSVVDGLSVPVLDAAISPVNRVDATIQAVADGPRDGKWMLQLMSDIIDSTDPYGRYVGNWIVNVNMPSAPSKELVLALPAFKDSNQQFTRSYPVNFREVQTPSPLADFFVVDFRDETIGPSWGTSAPFLAKGNIRVKSPRTLTIGPDALIVFPDTAPGRSIVVETGATLKLNGSIIKGNLAIYVEAGAKVIGRGLDSDGGLGSLGGDVDVKDVKLRGGLGGMYATLKAEDFKVGGQTNASAGEFALTSALFADDVTLASSKIAIRDMHVIGDLRFEGYQGDLEVDSLTYKTVIIEKGVTLKRNWKLSVEVLNGGERLVQGANVTLEPLHSLGTPLKAPVMTGSDGRSILRALGEIVTRNKTEYVGNYRVQVVFDARDKKHVLDPPGTVGLDGDKEILVRFDEDFVPPLQISTSPIFEREQYDPGTQVVVTGTLLYNGGPDPVVGAKVTLFLIFPGTEIGSTKTDSTGIYRFTFNAPPVEGTYTVRVIASDNTTNLSTTATKTFVVKKSETLQFTVMVFAILIVSAIVSLWAVSRYRKWQEFKRDARENPLFKEERHFDEVERQLRTELARELHGRPTRTDSPTILSTEVGENGRGKRKRGGGLLGTDGGSGHLVSSKGATAKGSDLGRSVVGLERRP